MSNKSKELEFLKLKEEVSTMNFFDPYYAEKIVKKVLNTLLDAEISRNDFHNELDEQMSLMEENRAREEADRRTKEDGKERTVYQNPKPFGPWWIKQTGEDK